MKRSGCPPRDRCPCSAEERRPYPVPPVARSPPPARTTPSPAAAAIRYMNKADRNGVVERLGWLRISGTMIGFGSAQGVDLAVQFARIRRSDEGPQVGCRGPACHARCRRWIAAVVVASAQREFQAYPHRGCTPDRHSCLPFAVCRPAPTTWPDSSSAPTHSDRWIRRHVL
jgi:hypothetical protein